MTAMQMATGTAVLATAAIPASEIALSPEQIEAIGSWRLHIVLGAVAVIAMILSARMFRYALARIESITAMQARALSDLSEAIHRAALADQRLADHISNSPCLIEKLHRIGPRASSSDCQSEGPQDRQKPLPRTARG